MDDKMTESKETSSFFKKNWVQNSIWGIGFLIIFLILRPFMQGDVAEGIAPNFTTESITGQTINLTDYQGKPVLIHFWATWCPICELELDGIEAVAKDYQVIKIATSSGSNHELIEYAKKNGMALDNIVNDEDGELMRLYGAKAVPASFVVDETGQIQFIEVGFTTSYGLKARLWSLK